MHAYKGAFSTVFDVMQTTRVDAVNDIFRCVNLRVSNRIPQGTIIEIWGVRA